MLSYIHADNLFSVMAILYILAILIWVVICYYIVKIWERHKQKKRK